MLLLVSVEELLDVFFVVNHLGFVVGVFVGVGEGGFLLEFVFFEAHFLDLLGLEVDVFFDFVVFGEVHFAGFGEDLAVGGGVGERGGGVERGGRGRRGGGRGEFLGVVHFN